MPDLSEARSLDETIPGAVMASIAARPAAKAVVEPERRVSYGELGELVLASTRAMIGAGVGPGDRVAVWAPNGLGWIVAALGAQCAGAALVPINTRFKGEEAAWLLSASKAPVLVTTVGFLDTDTVGMLSSAETPLPELRRIVLLPGSQLPAGGARRPSSREAPDPALLETWGDFLTHGDEIVYVRGTGQGECGPDADKGSYDSLAFWARAGVAAGARRPEDRLVPVPPAPGFGDSIGGMTIAGGIMGALFHRERTGKATVVDVSLLGTGLWAMGQAMALSLVLKMPWAAPPADRPAFNPLTRNYETKDGRMLAFTCLQPGKYWPLLCDTLERPDLKQDPRFADARKLMENSGAATAILEEIFASATLAEWCERLASFEGQWCIVQDTLEAAADPQTIANGYLQDCRTADGTAFRLVAVPIQYDEEPAVPSRAPEFNEHGDEILCELGLDMNAILDLKARGVVA